MTEKLVGYDAQALSKERKCERERENVARGYWRGGETAREREREGEKMRKKVTTF